VTYQIDPYELELINGCLNNDRMSQKNLYERYCKAMYTITHRMLNDYDEANDSLQEAFIQVFRDMDKFKKESSLGAWIKTIVVRSALAKLRKQVPVYSMEEVRYENEVIEWDSNLTGRHLDKAIQELPAGYRSVFVLTEVEGYSHKEVGEILGISDGTSKSQLFNAKKMLQKKLKELVN
jgi:RNA polymerase sigma factor (sigma-70 family)